MSLEPRLSVPISDETGEKIRELTLRYPLIPKQRIYREALRIGVDCLAHCVPSGFNMPIPKVA